MSDESDIKIRDYLWTRITVLENGLRKIADSHNLRNANEIANNTLSKAADLKTSDLPPNPSPSDEVSEMRSKLSTYEAALWGLATQVGEILDAAWVRGVARDVLGDRFEILDFMLRETGEKTPTATAPKVGAFPANEHDFEDLKGWLREARTMLAHAFYGQKPEVFERDVLSLIHKIKDV